MTMQIAKAGEPAVKAQGALRIVQRVVLPSVNDADSLPLYVDSGFVSVTGTGTTDPSKAKEAKGKVPSSVKTHGEAVTTEDIVGRTSARIAPGARLSFATYFNAFPASYWRRWTVVDTVRLTVRVSGDATVIVYKSNARGNQQRVTSYAAKDHPEHSIDLSLKPFGDGGWYWFDIVGHTGGAVLESAEWAVPEQTGRRGRTSMAITTYNRPDYCVNTIRTIADDAGLRDVLDELIIVDQGTQKVRDEDGFGEVAERMGSQLRIVEQGNIGGSGGFSRGMYETVRAGRSDYVILLDDDIILEPEGVSRLVAFADFTKKPTIVGGHMFDMYNRTIMHTFGEIVNPWRIQPDLPHEDNYLGHDFATSNLRSTPWLHRRTDVDYNGWWMCLIPTTVIRKIGLSLPVFIKWDDSEYGLRAKENGIPTVSLPGAAVWHVSWTDKDDLVGWQAYFHERNRLITALLHSLYKKGGRVLRESNYMDVKHLISMQYYTEAGRLMAMKDVLEGPGVLHDIIGKRLPEIRAMAKEYSDAKYRPDPDEFPPPARVKPPNRGRGFRMPSRVMLVPWAAKTLAKQLAKPVKAQAKTNPEATIAHQDARWWRLSQYDSAVVTNADGTAAAWYKRQPAMTRAMLAESIALHGRLLAEWDKLKSQFRDALPEITSIEAWERTFRNNPPS